MNPRVCLKKDYDCTRERNMTEMSNCVLNSDGCLFFNTKSQDLYSFRFVYMIFMHYGANHGQ